jgi:hypothetical protein
LKYKEESRRTVSNQAYRDWICEKLLQWKRFDDEWFNESNAVDSKYGQLLGCFFNLVEQHSSTEIASFTDNNIGFVNRGYYIKIKDIYAKIVMVWGQGSYTFIEMVTKEEAENQLQNMIKYIDINRIWDKNNFGNA